ncbi:MAG: VanZ family protein [Methylophilaceae bacterium]
MTKASFWLACLAITTLSLSPIEMLTAPIFDWWDKAQHASAFLVLCCLGLFAYPTSPRRVIFGLLMFGIGIEFMQYLTGYRFAELSDFLADTVGVTLGTLVMWLAEKQRAKITPKSLF